MVVVRPVPRSATRVTKPSLPEKPRGNSNDNDGVAKPIIAAAAARAAKEWGKRM
jgi:hypothetical protein